jgi:hypothetical protein
MNEDVKRVVSKWNFPERLDLSEVDVPDYSYIPKNVTDLDISGSKLPINYLPHSVKRLTYNAYAFSEVNIVLPNLEYLDISENRVTRISHLPKSLKTLVMKNSIILGEIEKLPENLETLIISKAESLKLPNLPSKLKVFIVEECHLSALPNLPSTLEELDCGYNKIRELPILPDSLLLLNCQNNQIITISELPPKLQKFKCSRNQIIDLPDLPDSLFSLNVNHNNISVILRLPSRLEKLHCVECQLLTLPNIPSTLKKLHCGKNNILLLPELPTSLKELLVDNNPISYIEYFPRKLQILDISNCKFPNLPTIPANVSELYCNGIPLKELPRFSTRITHLSIKNTEIDKLPELWDKLVSLDCSNNFLTKLPALPQSMYELNCSYNKISKLPKLPAELEYIDCSHNKLTSLPKIGHINLLNVSHNLLTELPTFESIDELNLSYNLITTLETLQDNVQNLDISFNLIKGEKELQNIPRGIKLLNMEGNPVYNNIKPDIRTPYFSYVTRYFKNEKVNVTVIPKGTVLFKGYNETKQILSDYTGWYKSGEKYSYVWPNFNVFFYPYPFVVDEIDIVSQSKITMVTYILQNDVNVILGVLPSSNLRDDRHKSKYLNSCNTLKVSKHFEGLHYDPCFNPEFMEQNSDIIGSLFISETDSIAHKTITGKNVKLLKYRHFFQDRENHIGVPEIILYPFKKRHFEEIQFERSTDTLYNVIKKNINLYNYKPISIEEHYKSKESSFKNFIDKMLSPEGVFIDDKILHMTIDTVTNFYVIAEFVDEKILNRCIPIEEKNKLKYLT